MAVKCIKRILKSELSSIHDFAVFSLPTPRLLITMPLNIPTKKACGRKRTRQVVWLRGPRNTSPHTTFLPSPFGPGAWLSSCISRSRFAFASLIIRSLCSSSIPYNAARSPLPPRECLPLSDLEDPARRRALVDFIFFSERSSGSGLGSRCLLSRSLLSCSLLSPLRDFIFRISRVIRSSVLPTFLRVGSTVGLGDDGRGLLRDLLLVLGKLSLLLRDVPKLMPESALLSAFLSAFLTSAISFLNMSTVIAKHSSITLFAVLRYLSTISRTTDQPFSSCARRL